MKTCSKCKTEYPATTEHFPPEKRVKSKLRSWCRVCYRKYCRKYYKGFTSNYYQTINGHLRGIYGAMKQRCTDKNHRQYKNYGSRGIRLEFTSDEFVDYVVNVLKIDPRGLEIDRINNDKSYESGNIRFVTCSENNRNKRNSLAPMKRR